MKIIAHKLLKSFYQSILFHSLLCLFAAICFKPLQDLEILPAVNTVNADY